MEGLSLEKGFTLETHSLLNTLLTTERLNRAAENIFGLLIFGQLNGCDHKNMSQCTSNNIYDNNWVVK